MLSIKNVTKSFGIKEGRFEVIKGIDLEIKDHEFIVLLGASGSGKTTLLNMISGLEKTDGGEIFYDSTDITKLSNSKSITFRRENIGYIFQKYHLLPNLTVRENIELGVSDKKQYEQIDMMLKKVDLYEHGDKLPTELSGGQQQRTSILRALIKNPKVLICDEPTGALDQKSGIAVLELIQKFHQESNMTVLMVTHNDKIANLANRVIHLKDGLIERIENNIPKRLEEIEW
ncbi:ABC transporter ATP-binding protein [Lysinibacillus xylanilyticus]|uniref:ABC transporter ATP-binding protein n=1 Tax=Lysinibacillus xylanilyticus TaxID=582475 RepID=UPI003D071947